MSESEISQEMLLGNTGEQRRLGRPKTCWRVTRGKWDTGTGRNLQVRDNCRKIVGEARLVTDSRTSEREEEEEAYTGQTVVLTIC